MKKYSVRYKGIKRGEEWKTISHGYAIMSSKSSKNMKDSKENINWSFKYFWIKLQIWVLTPLVWLEKQWNEYKEARFEAYVKYQIMREQYNK